MAPNDGSPAESAAVAVVGSGVAGLACAFSLAEKGYSVHLLERSNTLGGHADTRIVGKTQVDVGFMVYNNVTYPNMAEWFTRLGVVCEPSDMSFSVSKHARGFAGESQLEWSSDGLSGMFATRSNIVSRSHWRMLAEMLRFEHEVERFLQQHNLHSSNIQTLSEFVHAHGFSEYFVHNYLVPVCSSIWSTPGSLILQSSAESILRFMRNHHMLQLLFRPAWLTVAGRSSEYVTRVRQYIENNGGKVFTGASIERAIPDANAGSVALYHELSSVPWHYKRVVLAVHAPDALAMLGRNATPLQQKLLNSFTYCRSKLYLHRDARYMPWRRSAWASWNFMSSGEESGNVCLTYWLNRLQNLGEVAADPPDESKDGDPVLVTLNPSEKPRGVVAEWETSHPMPSAEANSAAKWLHSVQGQNNVYICGAYEGFGFHEDGVKSGFACAAALSDDLGGENQQSHTDARNGLDKPKEDEAKGPFAHGHHVLRPNPPHMLVTGHHYVARLFCVRFLRSLITCGRLVVTEKGGDSFSFGDGTDPRCTGPCTVFVHSSAFYRKLAVRSDLGFADAYVQHDIECMPSIQAVLELVIVNRDVSDNKSALCNSQHAMEASYVSLRQHAKQLMLEQVNRMLDRASGLATSIVGSTLAYWSHLSRRNTLKQARRNISAHYDLSNDLFRLFLDSTMTYSCAVFKSKHESLETAQRRKLTMLAEKAKVKRGQRVLDIGFGWGSLAILLAKEYGCYVTGITLSTEQLHLAREKVANADVLNQVELLLKDYRNIATEPFDRIVSCEMLEAIGHEYLGEFFWHCDRLLKPSGLVTLQVITTPEVRYETYKKSSDFIKEYIFPGACCPSYHALVDAAARKSSFMVEQAEDIGGHYAETLLRWRDAFLQKETELKKLGFSDTFIRTWDYYFQYCAAGFNTRTLGDMQIVFTRTGNCASLDGVPSCCMGSNFVA